MKRYALPSLLLALVIPSIALAQDVPGLKELHLTELGINLSVVTGAMAAIYQWFLKPMVEKTIDEKSVQRDAEARKRIDELENKLLSQSSRLDALQTRITQLERFFDPEVYHLPSKVMSLEAQLAKQEGIAVATQALITNAAAGIDKLLSSSRDS